MFVKFVRISAPGYTVPFNKHNILASNIMALHCSPPYLSLFCSLPAVMVPTINCFLPPAPDTVKHPSTQFVYVLETDFNTFKCSNVTFIITYLCFSHSWKKTLRYAKYKFQKTFYKPNLSLMSKMLVCKLKQLMYESELGFYINKFV